MTDFLWYSLLSTAIKATHAGYEDLIKPRKFSEHIFSPTQALGSLVCHIHTHPVQCRQEPSLSFPFMLKSRPIIHPLS
jgi:hypothetical protein